MDRFKIGDIDNERYYQIPKSLFCGKYRSLSSDARVIYAALKDRMELSRQNKWYNEQGEIYLLFTKENLGELVGVSAPTVYKAMQQLKNVELIEEIRQGLGRPNKIFICRIDTTCFSSRTKESLDQDLNNFNIRPKNILDQDIKNFNTNEPEYSETEYKEYNAREDDHQNDGVESAKQEKEPSLSQKRFEEFWRAYPRRVGKGAAERAYSKIKPDEALHRRILSAVLMAKQSFSWQKDNGQYIPNPATWLNQRRWEDELPEAPGADLVQKYGHII